MDLAPAAASDLRAVTKNIGTLVCSIQNGDECLSYGSLIPPVFLLKPSSIIYLALDVIQTM